jgi:hypothetical protein
MTPNGQMPRRGRSLSKESIGQDFSAGKSKSENHSEAPRSRLPYIR